jgi:carbamoyltransferase
MNILGLSAHFHDSACCVLQEGKLVAAAQEERFTRVKHDPRIPKEALRYCLREADLTIAEVDCVAYYEDPRKKLDRQLWMGLPQLPAATPQNLFRLDATRPERDIRELLGFEGRLEFVEHHKAHAASAFFFSGFDEAAVLTVDAVGEWATTAYGRARGVSLELFEEVHFPHSLGLLYSAITAYLGFEVNDAEYKVMGLAPYGEPKFIDEIKTLIEPLPGGQFRLNLKYFDFFGGERMFSDELVELLGSPPREPESELSQFAKDVAQSLQFVLEEILIDKVRYLHGLVPNENLCLAGGVALNCVAIERIAAHGPFAHVFVQPAATDAGGALGAAALAHIRLTGEAPDTGPMTHVYLGPSFSSALIGRLLRPTAAEAEDFTGREDELVDAVAERLDAGEVIGWFQGRMEFGPRALGNRSILADPRDPAMRDHINALVKKREAFRPFAPAVLDSKASDHFALDHPTPFMVETCQVTSALDLPAITHVDGSARPQTVDDTNPRLQRLLKAFERLSGCPVLLNTSFNLRGEPIVCTPVDALLCFIRSDLDCLVLEDFVLDRSGLPRPWLDWFRDTSPRLERAIGDTVYTLL